MWTGSEKFASFNWRAAHSRRFAEIGKVRVRPTTRRSGGLLFGIVERNCPTGEVPSRTSADRRAANSPRPFRRLRRHGCLCLATSDK